MNINPLHRYTKWYQILYEWLIMYVATQITVTAVSLPFLVAWGIPFSIASIAGNFLFTPFIFAFLFVSALFFICTLAGYTPWILMLALEKIGDWWVWILHLGSPSWLIAVPYSSPVLLIIYSLILIYASVTTSWHRLYKKPLLSIFLVFLGASMFCLGNMMLNTHDTSVEKKLVIQPLENHHIKIYDAGYLSQSGSTTSRVQYDLKKIITQKYGTPLVDEYLCNKLNKKTCTGLEQLINLVSIKKIILPPLKEMPKDFWRIYYRLKRTCIKQDIEILHSRYACKTVTNIFGSSPAQKTRYTALQKGMFV